MSRNEKLVALSNKIPEKLTKSEMEQFQDKIKERDNTMVTGVFRNLEKAGTGIKFPFRVHKGPINIYTMEDGGMYTVPYAVGYHLEHNCNTIVFKRGRGIPGSNLGSINPNGIATGAATSGMEGGHMQEEAKIPRYSFLSTDIPQRSSIYRR